MTSRYSTSSAPMSHEAPFGRFALSTSLSLFGVTLSTQHSTLAERRQQNIPGKHGVCSRQRS